MLQLPCVYVRRVVCHTSMSTRVYVVDVYSLRASVWSNVYVCLHDRSLYVPCHVAAQTSVRAERHSSQMSRRSLTANDAAVAPLSPLDVSRYARAGSAPAPYSVDASAQAQCTQISM